MNLLKAVCTLTVAFILPIVVSSQALAAFRERRPLPPSESFSVTPIIGGILFSSPQSLNPTQMYGLKIGYDMTGNNVVDSLGVEGTFNYFSTAPKTGASTAPGYLFRADAIYSISPRNKLVPFLAVGLGELSMSGSNGARENSPLLNYGPGLKYYLEDYLALRIDARHLLVYKDVNTRNGFELSTGITYYFGKERKKKAPPVLPKAKLPEIDKAKPYLPEGEPVETPGKASQNLSDYLAGGYALGFPAPIPLYQAPAPVAPPVGNAQAFRMPEPPPAGQPSPPPPPVGLGGAAVPAQAQPASKRPEAGRTLKQLTIEFAPGSAALRPAYLKKIAAAAAQISAAPHATVRVEGHTDGAGQKTPGSALFGKRAEAVRNQLVKLGVAPKMISVKGYPFSRPKAPGDSEAARQKERREQTELTIEY